MREAMFIKKNKDKWIAYQHEETQSPDELAERFTTLIDDVSYAKTYYPKSTMTKWVNGLAATLYQSIYQSKKGKYKQIGLFWKYDLPFLFKKYHKVFLFTTIFFCLMVTMGVLASIHDPDFVRGTLGNQYVDMTEDNIRRGDPFGVYKDKNPFTMFITIAFNNIKVAFITFLGGFTVGVVSMKVLWDNGLMLGTFQYLFFANGLGMQSVLVIWIHGTIEISSIIIAGTAGFILAKSILFPGTFTRTQSLKMGGKDAAKVMIALIPFFIVAAFLESYITHLMSATYDGTTNTFLPSWVSVLILFLSLSLIIWYFVIWPIILSKRGYVAAKDDVISRLVIKDA